MKLVNVVWRVAGWASKVIALALVAAPAAFAVDGVFEINQAKMLANGATYPFNIANSGSYRLTSNINTIVVPFSQDRTVITITASNVTLDLNGFTINGTNTCTTPNGFGFSIQCTNSGTGIGIQVTGPSNNIVIKNGIIRGMGGAGIDITAGSNHVIENVTVTESGGVGIRIVSGRVNHAVAVRNYLNGISVQGGMISDVYSSLNGGNGIHMEDGAIVASNASANGGFGLQLGNTVGYSNVTATYNNGGAGSVQVSAGVSGTGNVCNHSLVSSACP
jgi:hypothetical protein